MDFRERLTDALVQAAREIVSKVAGERLYAFALYTSGQDDFQYVSASANTEEGLREKAGEYASKHPDYSGEPGIRKLRWSAPDWKYHDFSEPVASLELPNGEGRKRDSAVYRDFVHAMKVVGKEVLPSRKDAPVCLLIMCGDMGDEFLLEGMRELNPASVTDRYVQEFTARPYLDAVKKLPAARRLEVLIDLYRDLNLDSPSQLALDARSRNVTQYSLEPLITQQGPEAVARLLDLIEKHGFEPTFNEKGSPEFRKHGAFTPSSKLSTGATFLIADCKGVDHSHLQRMQGILSRRVSLDKALPITSTLAENLARVLHALKPRTFPSSKLNPKSNHLDNPESFLP